MTMVSQVKKLNGDEKIRQQLQAREDYERRMIGEYNRGNREGKQLTLAMLVNSGKLSIEDASEVLGVTKDEFQRIMSQ